MSEWVDVEAVDALPPGGRAVADVDGVMVAVFNVDGRFHAIEDICPHDGGELASGCLEGEEIECPRHGARFNVRTGKVLCPPAYEDVAVFPTRVVNDVVQVRDDRWD